MARFLASPFAVVLMVLGCRVLPPGSKQPGQDGSAHTGVDTQMPSQDGDSAGTDTAPTIDPQATRAVVLVLDGARIDETLGDGISSVTDEPTTDFLNEIRSQLLPMGSVVDLAMNAGTTITAEGHAALLTGRRIHLSNMPSDDGPGAYVPDIPTLFQQLLATRDLTAEQTALVANTVHLRGHVTSNHPGHGAPGDFSLVTAPDSEEQPANDDLSVIEAVQNALASRDAHLVVANLHQIDRAGHYNSRRLAYAERVKEVDEPIVNLWNWIQSTPPFADQTVLVIVSDHGRHRHGTPEDYRHHGDQCAGCRQVPLLWLGPGIKQGFRSPESANLTDVARTLANLLDVPLPHSTGRILHEISDEDSTPADDTSVRSVSDIGGHTAWSSRSSTSGHTQIFLDGDVVSDSEALLAEGPTLASHGGSSVLCWRQLHWAEGDLASWPWTPSCLRKPNPESEWQPLNPPFEMVAMNWTPDLSIDPSGELWMSMVDNPSGYWENEEQALRLLRWSPSAGWRGSITGVTDIRGAVGSSHVRTSLATWVSVITSDMDITGEDGTPVGGESIRNRARYRRHAAVYRVDVDEELGNSWSKVWRGYTSDHFDPDSGGAAPSDAWEGWATIQRMDHAVLTSLDDQPVLAFMGFRNDGTQGLWTVRPCEGTDTWCDPEPVADSSGALPHVGPVWDGGVLYWAQWDEGPAICRSALTEPIATSECRGSSGEAIERLAVDDGKVTITAYIGGQWEPEEVTW